jgi:hypothetical protein
MPARDAFHDHVKTALIKDGWRITDDPLSLPWGGTFLQVDLGAERLITAEKATRKIAVEVKSFLSPSRMEDLEDALGQLVLYRHVLGSYEPDRELYLAIREDVYLNFFDQPHVTGLCAAEEVCLIVFNSNSKEIVQWIP